jgi:hypothetical protein
MATRASFPARFVTPARRRRGQRSPLSSTIFETAISEFRFNHWYRTKPISSVKQQTFIGGISIKTVERLSDWLMLLTNRSLLGFCRQLISVTGFSNLHRR